MLSSGWRPGGAGKRARAEKGLRLRREAPQRGGGEGGAKVRRRWKGGQGLGKARAAELGWRQRGGIGEEVGGGRPPIFCLYNNYITTI